jgi:hypothetical protein
MDSTVLLVGAAILVGWIVLTLLAKERQIRVREHEAKERAEAAAKPALPEPSKPALPEPAKAAAPTARKAA